MAFSFFCTHTHSAGEDHYVKIHKLEESQYTTKFGDAARTLGKMWNISHSNARDTPGGGMLSLGVSKGGGCQEHMVHGPTNSDRIKRE